MTRSRRDPRRTIEQVTRHARSAGFGSVRESDYRDLDSGVTLTLDGESIAESIEVQFAESCRGYLRFVVAWQLHPDKSDSGKAAVDRIWTLRDLLLTLDRIRTQLEPPDSEAASAAVEHQHDGGPGARRRLRVSRVGGDVDGFPTASRYELTAGVRKWELTREFYAQGPTLFLWCLTSPDGSSAEFARKRDAVDHVRGLVARAGGNEVR